MVQHKEGRGGKKTRFEAVFEHAAGVPVQGLDESGVINHWNSACEQLYGYSESEAVGERIQDLVLSGETAVEFQKTLEQVWKNVEATRTREWPIRTKSGEERWVCSTLFPVSEEGKMVEVLCMDVDVTGLKTAEDRADRLKRLYTVLSKTSEATIRIREWEKLYERICRIAVEDGLYRMAWVGVVNPETKQVDPVAHWGYEEGYLENLRISVLEIPEGLGPTGTAIRENRYVVCDDFERDPRVKIWRERALKRGYRSNAAFPLRLGGIVIGALNLYSSEPDFFDEEQIRLLEALTEDVSFAIESLEIEDQRRRAEETLRHSEEYFRSLIDNVSDIIVIVESDGSFRYTSPSVQRVLGYKRSELRGKPIFQFIHQDDIEKMRDAQRQITGDPDVTQSLEVRFRHRDGSWRTIEVVGRGFTDSEGLFGIILNARDVTERKVTEEAQRKDRDFISAVLETTGALVAVLELQGRIVLFNKTCEQTTGYSLDEARGKHIWDFLLSPEDVALSKATFRKLKEGVFPGEHEGYWLAKHGSRRLIAWSNTLLYDEAGSVEYVVSTGIDVTERRKVERALKESEEKYRAIFESTGTAMCIIERDTTISFLNQEFERMTGYGAEEVENQRAFTDFLFHEDIDDFMSQHREVQRGMRKVPVHFEFRVLDRRRSTLNVMANMALLPGMNSNLISLIDITREKSYEQELKQTAERLRHFITVASHELRHPITIVKGYASILTEHMESMPSERVQEILKDIDSSTDRLTHYVEELMDVARVEEGRFPMAREKVDSGEPLGLALEDMRIMGWDNEITVEVATDTGSLEVDPEKFVQLMVILLENAVKFSAAGSPVQIEVGRQRDEVLVSILDRGIGVPEREREMIFDRFYQVEDALHHSKPGIGLGLYIAKEIVSAHQRRIWHEPRRGGGSIFRFTVK